MISIVVLDAKLLKNSISISVDNIDLENDIDVISLYVQAQTECELSVPQATNSIGVISS